MGRYADDVIMCSFCICRECVQRFLFETYKGVVKFDIATDYELLPNNTISQKFLDFVLHLDFQGVRLLINHKNERYALTGNPEDRCKRSILLFTGLWSKQILHQILQELKLWL